MNTVQVFNNPDFGQIRTVLIEGEPWFVGCEIAKALGYSNSRDAMRKHIDPEDRQTYRGETSDDTVAKRDGMPGNPNRTIINESGLYSLILSSKLPEAKKFKRWVTSEVLPALRKTGKYALPDTPEPSALPDPSTVRLLTPDDYINAARILSTCKSERLPYVLPMLEKAGIDFTDIPIPPLPRRTRPLADAPDLLKIAEFVNRPVPVDWNRYTLEERIAYWKDGDDKVSTVPRQTITAVEIWRELWNQRGDMTRADTVEINRYLDGVAGWKKHPTAFRAGPYGVQRGFVRED